MFRSFTGFFIGVMCVVLAAPFAYADVVVPDVLVFFEGNINNSFPFNISIVAGLTSQRYQQVYSGTAFGGSILISGMAFRPDRDFGSAFSSTLPNVQVSLSTTRAAVEGLSPTFANNIGGNVTTVFSGALSLSSLFTGPTFGPKDFDILIPFTTPFFYDPSLGNLLLDVSNFGGGTTTSFDAQDSPADSISRVISVDVNSLTGSPFRDGLVTKFTTSTVPEPGSVVFLSLGLAVFALVRRVSTR